jgi:hypothetical protein
MPILLPMFSILVVFAVYWVYCGFVFSGENLMLGLCAAVVMNVVWMLLAKWLTKSSWIAFYGMVWEIGLVMITAAYPAVMRGMSVGRIFWVGVGLAIVAVVVMYLGVKGGDLG